MNVLESRLRGRAWIIGDAYSIADIAMLGWVRHLVGCYGAGALIGYGQMQNVTAWLERGLSRPAVKRGLTVPGSHR